MSDQNAVKVERFECPYGHQSTCGDDEQQSQNAKECIGLYNVTLLCSDGAKRVYIDQDILLQVIKSLSQNGKETVRTRKGSYEVEGLVIGEIKGKILVF